MKNNNKNSKQSKDEVTTLDPATPLGDSELSLLAETPPQVVGAGFFHCIFTNNFLRVKFDWSSCEIRL